MEWISFSFATILAAKLVSTLEALPRLFPIPTLGAFGLCLTYVPGNVMSEYDLVL
jgi:hypothetical protein